MTLNELQEKLYWNNVPEGWYSLNEGLKPDAYIIYENYGKWEVFYLGERGDRAKLGFFINPEDAYDLLWERLRANLEVFKVAPRKQEGK